MKIFTTLNNIKILNPVITIGNFDGVHLGHQMIINQLIKQAKIISGETVIFTFLQHPRTILEPQKKNKLLQTNEEKIEKIKNFGIDNLILFNFTKNFAKLSSKQFIEQILVHRIGLKSLFVGFNHSFGKNRDANLQSLKTLAQQNNFTIEQLKALKIDNISISSTIIKQYIENGNITTANKLLGYNYTLNGTVVSGNKIGRTLGFPTANISYSENKLVPQNGVYLVEVFVQNNLYSGILNVGYRPTIKEKIKKKRVEVHILNFNSDIYGEKIQVFFKQKIRNEKTFENIEELKKQLIIDKELISS